MQCYTQEHRIAPHCIALHRIASHCIALHHIASYEPLVARTFKIDKRLARRGAERIIVYLGKRCEVTLRQVERIGRRVPQQLFMHQLFEMGIGKVVKQQR